MKTRIVLPLASAILMLSLCLPATAQQDYNVLFIAVDDMNVSCSLFGNTEVASPNLERLASHGMVFTRAYAQFPLCNPSRTSILSGWRPDKTGIKNNNVRPRSLMGSDVVFLPEYFRNNGYRTERYGKMLHGSFENDITWDYAVPPEKNGDTGFDKNITRNSDSSIVTWWVQNTDDTSLDDNKIAGELIASMRQPHVEPFFYGVGFTGTHLPFSPGLKYWNMNGDPTAQQPLKTNKAGDYTNLKGNGSANIQLPNTPPGDRNDVPSIAFFNQVVLADTEWQNMKHAYYAEVSMVDAQLGLVLDELDRQDLWKNTVVVFWSDHGQHLGEHEGCWAKLTLFEESLHVPLVVCVPGKKPGTCSRLVELVDLYPTLAELCGLPTPAGMEGSSFVPLLDNPELKWKSAVFSQISRGGLNDLGRSITIKVNRYNSWGSEGEELYKHNTDPKEYTNFINNPDDSSLANKMRNLMAGGWTKALPPVYKKTTYYRDADNDGYGSAKDSVLAYWIVKGYVSNKNDCNDDAAAVHPGAPEICDNEDNNCNGLIDESCLLLLSVNSRNIAEGNSGTRNTNFTISLSQPGTSVIKVKVTTEDSTAIAGSDYTAVSKTVTFLAGETSKVISVSIIGDASPEPNETFKVSLSNSQNATILNGTGIGKIKNDDGALSPPLQQNQHELVIQAKPQLNKKADVWPNPAGNKLNIQLHHSFDSNTKIQLINPLGIKIKEWENATVSQLIELDLSSVQNGEYFLLISDAKGTHQTEKIIVRR